MINQLKPYPAYNDSGVEWLGEVPEHWEVLPNRALFNEVRERDHPEEQMLSVTINKGVIRQETLLADSSKKDSSNQDKSAYKLVRSGDIVYNKMRAWQGAVGVSNYQGIVSPAYVVQRPREDICSHYIHYLFRTPAFAKEAERWSYGITSDMWSLRPEHFKMIYACLPPDEEQTAIVSFLDYVDRRIRRYIHVRQKLIKLLEEQKQAIIHQAVTGQIDVRTGQPYPTYKPSGVEWLGEVPKHWQIAKLVQLTTRIGDGIHGTPEYVDESEFHFINGNNLWNGTIKITSTTRCVSKVEFQKYKIDLDDSTILMSINGTIGNLAFYRGESIVLGKSAAYINCDKFLARCFLFFFLQSLATKEFFQLELTGTTILNLSLASIRNLLVALPSLTEQIEISSFLEVKMTELDNLINRTHHEINLLREYHTRLIAEVVTGKLDVREAAANLPEESDAEEPEPLEETEMESGEDEDIADEDREAVSGEVG